MTISQQDTIIDNYSILAFGWNVISCKYATKKREGVNPLTKKNVFECVKRELNFGKKVICFMHWNYELELYPQPRERKIAHDLIDMGVDAIVGCHSHRVNQIEIYKGKPIVYSLGNFLFRENYYFDKKLSFPDISKTEWCFEIKDNNYFIHEFEYNKDNNSLVFLRTYNLVDNFYGMSSYSNLNDEEYEIFFRKHRIQKKLLPIFLSKESQITYSCKVNFVKFRGRIINMLLCLKVKSPKR